MLQEAKAGSIFFFLLYIGWEREGCLGGREREMERLEIYEPPHAVAMLPACLGYREEFFRRRERKRDGRQAETAEERR